MSTLTAPPHSAVDELAEEQIWDLPSTALVALEAEQSLCEISSLRATKRGDRQKSSRPDRTKEENRHEAKH